jgi:dTDP-4-amino-4,6-dideoxygalactose transaminase
MGLPETNPGAQASASVLLTPFDLAQAPTSARRGFSFGASASAGALTFFVSEGCQSGPGNGLLQTRNDETAQKWYALYVMGLSHHFSHWECLEEDPPRSGASSLAQGRRLRPAPFVL